jgi:DDB1- and CUL4-associated factor 11
VFFYSCILQRETTSSRSILAQNKAPVMERYLPNTTVATFESEARNFCGLYSASGDILVLAAQDGRIQLFCSRSLSHIKSINARDIGWAVVDVTMSPDDRFVAYSSWSDSFHVTNVFGEFELHESYPLTSTHSTHNCMFSIKFSPHTSNEILGGGNHGYMVLYDLERRTKLSHFRAHDDDINAVSYLDETGTIFATGSDDTVCKVWDSRIVRTVPDASAPLVSRRPKPVGGFIGHHEGLTSVASALDRRYVLTNSKDQSMKLWDLRRMQSDTAMTAFVAKRSQGTQRFFDYRWHHYRRGAPRLEVDTSLQTYSGHSVQQTLIRCGFSPVVSTAQKYVYTGSGAGEVVIYETLTGEIAARLHGHQSIVRDVSWHPTEPTLISTSWDCTSRIYQFRKDHQLTQQDRDRLAKPVHTI